MEIDTSTQPEKPGFIITIDVEGTPPFAEDDFDLVDPDEYWEDEHDDSGWDGELARFNRR